MLQIILPVHNRRETTLQILRHLQKQSFTQWRLILVDDGSTDGTAEHARELLPSITVVKGSGNLWWAGGLQAGIDLLKKEKTSHEDLVLFLNDDQTFDEDFLSRL